MHVFDFKTMKVLEKIETNKTPLKIIPLKYLRLVLFNYYF